MRAFHDIVRNYRPVEKNVYLLIVSVALVSFVMSCCRNSEDCRALDKSEAIMNECPDSALVLLENIDRTALRGREANARYSLILSMALDKNAVDTSDISIILPALRYYEGHGNALRKAQTYFYYSRVLQNSGASDEALEAISKAELYAGQTDDRYLQGLIADNKGRMFESMEEYEEALRLYRQALDIFIGLGHKRNVMYMLENISGVYIILNDSGEAVKYALLAKDIALEEAEVSDIILARFNVALAYYYDGDNLHEALKELTDVAEEYFSGDAPSSFYILLSQIYLAMGDFNSARYYAGQRLETAEDSELSGVYALLQEIEYLAGNYKLSCEYYDLCLEAMGKQRLVEYEESVHEADMRYKNGELMEIITAQKEHIRDASIIWSLAIVSVGVTGLSAVQARRRKLQEKDAEINEYRNRISAMQEYGSFLEEVKASVPEKNELINRQLDVLARLMEILVRTHSKMRPPEYREFAELVGKKNVDGSEMMNMLRLTFESRYPGVKARVQSEHPELSGKDIDVYILAILGCSASVTAYILGTTEGYVYNRRSVLRKKLGMSDMRISFSEHLQVIQHRMPSDNG